MCWYIHISYIYHQIIDHATEKTLNILRAMSRLIFPEDFLSQTVLFKHVKNKFESLPPANVLVAYLTQHNISFETDETARFNAQAFEDQRMAKSHAAQNCTQQRDLKFEPVFSNMRDYYQFLKKFYSPNYMEIGLWGAPITVSGRIAYPNEFGQRVIIFQQLNTKYNSYDPLGSSPLDPYLAQHGLSIGTNELDVTAADSLNEQAKALAGEAEDHTQDRNNAWNPVMDHLRAIGGYLMSLYNNNPKELGLWGFNVDDSPRAPKEVVSKVKLSSQLTVNSLIIGGTLKNIGTVPLTVYKGSAATGTAITVLPNDMYGITKGFSTITVVNPSNTTEGVFSALRAR